MTLCEGCYNPNLYCLDCRDSADGCTKKDHNTKCLKCGNRQKNKNPVKLRLNPYCQKCLKYEGVVKGKFKDDPEDVLLCDLCALTYAEDGVFISA